MVTQQANSEKSFTADQVIEEYYRLSAPEQEKVRRKLKPAYHFKYRDKAGYVIVVVDKRTFQSTKAKAGIRRVKFFKRIPYSKDKSIFLSSPNQLWHLKALLGDELVDQAFEKNTDQSKDQVIITLIKDNPLPFYINTAQSCLVMGTNELAERNFGPLSPISSIDALERFGLAMMEEANERGYTRL